MAAVQPGQAVAVTGATGFVGQCLIERLVTSGYEVIGISERREPPHRIAGLLSEYLQTDLTHGWPALPSVQGVVHLAGLAAVGPSFDHPQRYITENSAMVTNLFEDALRRNWSGRALVISSGAVYGGVGAPSGFRENSDTAATSPYVVSKLLVEKQAEYYRTRGLDALVARPFNHIGPGQRGGFIVPDLVRKVGDAKCGERISVGNLNSSRDYTDVRDIVAAYQLLLECSTPCHEVYNVCSGTAHTGWEILAAVCAALKRPIPETDSLIERAVDPQAIWGDASRIEGETGWRRTIALQQSVNDFVESLDGV